MSAIKTNILRRMDQAPPGVRICCVKFLQQVVLVQTPGVVDPRVCITRPSHVYASYLSQRPDHNDISLALVPRDHPLIPYATLEAEGHGLLDRLLDIIHGDHRSDRQVQDARVALTGYSDGLLVTATLNTLGMLMHRRPIIANKILNSVFNFNPLKLANSPLTPKNKVIMKSIERTTRALMMNVMKRYVCFQKITLDTLAKDDISRDPQNPINARIQQFLERVHRMRVEMTDESRRKRAAPSEPTDGLDHSKRQRLAAGAPSAIPSNAMPEAPPLPPGPVSWRQLYTLNPEGSTVNFDVQAFRDPEQLVRILVPVLQSVDQNKLGHAMNVCNSLFSLRGIAVVTPAPGSPRDVLGCHVTACELGLKQQQLVL
jgi:symplekin